MKPKIKTNKLNYNPLFIKFLNWKGDKYSIEFWMENLFEDDIFSRQIVKEKIKNLDDFYLNSLTDFQKNFKEYVIKTIAFQNISEEFLIWLNNAFKYVEESVTYLAKEEIRKIKIKNSEGRWFESIVCYNFIMTFNYFGVNIIKRCPICNSFFAHKGRWAKYCSEGCKERGMKKK